MRRRAEGEPCEVNILALLKGQERYLFIYDDRSQAALIDLLRDYAADPGLSFNWFDAAVLTDRVREQACQDPESLPPSRARI